MNFQQQSENKTASSRLMFSTMNSTEKPLNNAPSSTLNNFHQQSENKMTTTSSRLMFPHLSGTPKSIEKPLKPVDAAVFKKTANKCGCCKKKVGLVSFKCRCGIVFCASHRHPEAHNCTFFNFYFKVAAKIKLADANPRIVADKLQRL